MDHGWMGMCINIKMYVCDVCVCVCVCVHTVMMVRRSSKKQRYRVYDNHACVMNALGMWCILICNCNCNLQLQTACITCTDFINLVSPRGITINKTPLTPKVIFIDKKNANDTLKDMLRKFTQNHTHTSS